MNKHIYFVRHGETDSNAGGVFYGEKSMLTDLGREQAKVVAERFDRIKIDALISSTFQRALDTAHEIEKRTGLVIEPREEFVEWREPSFIYGKHKDEPAVKEIHTRMLERHPDPDHRADDEETVTELKARAQACLGLLEKHPADRICVVTHGAFLRVIVGSIMFGDDFNPPHLKQFFHHLSTNNTGITYVRNTHPEYGWQMVTWNDSAHLG
jgi:uncharacterized phosphatase